jgi:hypothetical protein
VKHISFDTIASLQDACLDDLQASLARQPLARIPHRRVDAMGLRRRASLAPCRRGVVRPLTLNHQPLIVNLRCNCSDFSRKLDYLLAHRDLNFLRWNNRRYAQWVVGSNGAAYRTASARDAELRARPGPMRYGPLSGDLRLPPG